MPRSTRGNRYIVVTTDLFSKFVVTRTLREATARAIVQHMEGDVFLTYGVPNIVLCDNGKQYTSKLFQDLLSKYGCRSVLNAYYHPQANPTERVNRVIVM
ncbi:integrase catalytic domain-containing protein [Klebsiella pneumoniae]|uniref:integrase catalytic domain-containing protein n=1 Tax=Klebsiella pneumoniae TaxID=573 RepID=UPI0040559423